MEVIDIWLSVVEISQPLLPKPHLFFSSLDVQEDTEARVRTPQKDYTQHPTPIAPACLVIHNLMLYTTDVTSHRRSAHFKQPSLTLCTPLKCELINTEPQGVFEPHRLDLIAWALCFCTN
ncbi:hypothetical protein Q8A67_007547 [Cirrhinus molitorella]|uniref:Uncharacterized protein n=1 Tax=Cirrhinus molitorella TaxID=172907 RepID=A0AA88PSU8_9TELE|nr:hypothetical protein Q8A67_007547 [Cirrhinus molitorella]